MSTIFIIATAISAILTLACPIWALWTLTKDDPFAARCEELLVEMDRRLATKNFNDWDAVQEEFDVNMAARKAILRRSDKAKAPFIIFAVATYFFLVLSVVTA